MAELAAKASKGQRHGAGAFFRVTASAVSILLAELAIFVRPRFHFEHREPRTAHRRWLWLWLWQTLYGGLLLYCAP